MAHLQTRTASALDRSNARGDFLLLSLVAMFAALLLTNNYNLGPRLFWLLLLPAAFFMRGAIRARLARPAPSISVAFHARYVFSLILLAVFLYLFSMTLSSWSQPDMNRRLVDQQWLFAGEILLFMAIVAHAVAFIDGFLTRLIAAIVPVMAVSAALNVWSYLKLFPAGLAFLDGRLTNWLGMPGYTNSTNISVTYAVFFVAALATIFDRKAALWMRSWLAPFAAVLLVAMFLTQSRGAYIGTAVTVIVILATSRTPDYWSRHGLKFFLALLIGFVALAAVPKLNQIVTNRGESLRPQIWNLYAAKAAKRPLIGYGGLSKIDILVDDQVIEQPHNLVLSSMIRGGIVCMLAMVTVLAGSLWWAFGYWRRMRNTVPLAMIATVAITGMFDYNLLITNATWPWVTFWFPFAVCAGAEIDARVARAGVSVTPAA